MELETSKSKSLTRIQVPKYIDENVIIKLIKKKSELYEQNFLVDIEVETFNNLKNKSLRELEKFDKKNKMRSMDLKYKEDKVQHDSTTVITKLSNKNIPLTLKRKMDI